MDTRYAIRDAVSADAQAIVAFTLREAAESEGLDVDEGAVRRGVLAAFADPPRARYWLAEDASGVPVASASVVTEWSDFRGGDYWWVQSLYVAPGHRGAGVADLMLAHIDRAAAAAHAHELRLYVHASNAPAIRAYRRCGFASAPYVILHRMPGVP